MTAHRPGFDSHAAALLLVGGSTGASVVLGAVRLKMVAVSIGASGLAGVAMVLAISAATAVIASCGISAGAASRLRAGNDEVVLTALRVGTRAAVPLSAGLAIVAWTLMGPTLDSAAEPVALVAVSLTASSMVLAAMRTSVLAGRRQFRRLAIAQTGTGGVATLVVGAATTMSSGVVLLAATALPSLLLALAARSTEKPPRTLGYFRLRDVMQEGKRLAGLGSVLSIPPVLLNSTQFLTSALFSSRAGLSEAGYFQGIWAISTGMLTMCLAAFNSVHLPRLAAARNDFRLIRRLSRSEAARVGACMGLASIALSVLGAHVLVVLYAKDFSSYAQALGVFLAGMTLKASGWAMAYSLLARARYALFLAVEVIWCLIFMGSLIALGSPNVDNASMAYLISGGGSLLLSSLFMRRSGSGAKVVAEAAI